METFLLQATIYLGAAVIAVPFAARLGLGSVLGYLAAGIVIGPLAGLVGTEAQDIQHFAEFGVVMMLFLIGLELEPRALWDMRDRLIGLGGLQITVTTLLIAGAGIALDYDVTTSIAIGMIFALSSTAIVLQTLSEKGLMQTGGGRSIFSVLLTQDIAVIPMLALLPLLASPSARIAIAPDGSMQRAAGSDADHHSLSLVEGLPGWGVTLVTIAAVGAVILTGIYLTRPVFRYIHQAKLREMYTALALLMIVAIAVLMETVGLSPALGTFLAGVVLANSEFRHELESDLAPFKGLLLGLFFITVGAGINFELLVAQPMWVAIYVLGIIIIKGGVLYALSFLFRMNSKDRWLFTLGLAQAGEFGFVLIAFSRSQGVLTSSLSELLLLVTALSMLVTPLLFIGYHFLTSRMTDEDEHEHDEVNETGTVIIAGIGRFGQMANRLIQSAGFSTVVIDNDLASVQTMRKFGYRGFFGDPTRPDLLAAAGIDEARVMMVCLDDRAMACQLTAYVRKVRPDIHIIARAYDRVHSYELYAAGADDIVREMFDSSLRAGRYALENLGLTEFEAAEAETMFYHSDRSMVRELAELWKPGVAIADNADYVARARKLDSNLETALASRVQGRDADADTLTPRRPGDTSRGSR
ncbi:monovalent cation:proton antiporter-2 (CPA2) family protein [Loktanella sp. SALINAS62]|uniref:monovalent cation:proton antiporter-2 (CPA2) family protein n=1 Tax=Loktanella sp. SALINAS62 TaxID=2706124 RepID=UPI001B8C6BCF|nr:monovalent cation:proton antiporter-2 (CPA2) family protein [Loktanella sp. SALINAS62]MBS1303905.1 potassium transporter [Loktanella sp. SALINAS62]